MVAWLAPVVAALVVLGPRNLFTQLALFFSFAATITFGGAYAVLAYIAQQAVDADVHIVGVSSLAAGHLALLPALKAALEEQGRPDIMIVIGGVIPPDDVATLEQMGAAAVFLPGTVIADSAIDLLGRLREQLDHFLPLVDHAIAQARRRVLQGEQVPDHDHGGSRERRDGVHGEDEGGREGREVPGLLVDAVERSRHAGDAEGHRRQGEDQSVRPRLGLRRLVLEGQRLRGHARHRCLLRVEVMCVQQARERRTFPEPKMREVTPLRPWLEIGSAWRTPPPYAGGLASPLGRTGSAGNDLRGDRDP